jgi:hypothetical protein
MSLLDQARNKQGSSDVTAWKPTEKGDGIEGRVLSVEYTPSDFPAPNGEEVMIPIITLEMPDGSKAGVRGYHSVLRKELEFEDPRPGDLLAVVYMGSEPLKTGKFKGRPVHVYRAVVQKANADTVSTHAGTGNGQPTPMDPPF